jgi:predicted DNA binding protein/ActR/RegA family two-component response regulator
MEDDPTNVARSYEIGDEPLEAVTVLLVDDDEAWARTMKDILERGDRAFSVTTAHTLQVAREAFDRLDPDCVVCDYWLRQGDGLDLLVHVRDRDPDRPFVLVTGAGSETVATDAIRQRVTDYVRKSVMSDRPDMLVGRVKSAVRTYRAERALVRERRGKEAMLEIVTATTSRDRLATDFCRHLVAERGYACAWIGAYDPARGLVPRAVAGHEDYLEDAVTPGQRPGDGSEPALVALERRKPHVVAPIDPEGKSPDDGTATGADPTEDGETAAAGRATTTPDAPPDRARDWRAAAHDRGFRVAAAVPIVHESTPIGVLAVYATDVDTVDDHERELLAEYAETIGHALRTAQWKESLLSSSPVTVDFEVTDDAAPLVALCRVLPPHSTIAVSSAIPQADGLLYLATVHGASAGDLRAAVDRVDATRSVEVTGTEGDLRCELATTAPTPESVLVEQGARFVGTVVERDVATVSVVRPEDRDLDALGDALEATFSDSTVAAFGTDRDHGSHEVDDAIEHLTEKQRQALELAYFGGYYQRPRENSATDLAKKLEISRSTFTQHLRVAERKLLGWLLGDGPG